MVFDVGWAQQAQNQQPHAKALTGVYRPRSCAALLRFGQAVVQVWSTPQSETGLNVRLPVPVQTVDATPSGIKLFSKVVFMKQGRRFGLSASRRATCGVVGRPGRRCMRSGALLAKNIPPFVVWCRVTVGLLRPSGGVRSRCGSERKSPEAGFRFVDP